MPLLAFGGRLDRVSTYLHRYNPMQECDLHRTMWEIIGARSRRNLGCGVEHLVTVIRICCPGKWCEALVVQYWARIDVGGLAPPRLRDVKSGDQQYERDSNLRFQENDPLQYFGILILVDLLPYTFAKELKYLQRMTGPPAFEFLHHPQKIDSLHTG